ncbi:MAG: hypothetical protein FJW86_06990 [Actinobacteria bacterium]|nr:hypothetical protein [Actinomycetota bacterium]
MRRTAGIVALTGMLVFLSACGGDDKSVSASGTTTTEAERTTTSTGPCTLAGATPDAKSGTGPDTISQHTDVRTGRQPCADRVVFEFRDGAAPAFDIEYRTGPFSFGESDMPVAVQGTAFLVITFPRASGVDLTTADATQTYTGPESIVPTGLTHVREVRRLEDFEAVLVWVIGLDGMRPFTMGQLTGPPRVYIDIG